MKTRFSLLLALLITFLFCFNSFALTASKSDAVRVSDFDDLDGDGFISFDDAGIMPLASLPSVINTVDNFSDMLIRFYYSGTDYKTHSINVPVSSDGKFTITKPSNYRSFGTLHFYFIYGGSHSILPSPGNYTLSMRYGSNVGGVTWSSPRLSFSYKGSNSQASNNYINLSNFSQESADFYFSQDLKVASNSSTMFFEITTTSGTVGFPLGGQLYINFKPISSSSSIVSTNPSPPLSSDDIQSNISDSVVDISNTVNNISSSIADTAQSVKSGFIDVNASLRELIQTISLQLEAFWQQLYIGIHVPNLQNRDENTKKITDAIDTLDSDVLDGFDKLEDSNNDNTNEINNNITNNFDDLKNGYDDSTGQEQNQILSDSLQEYQDLEDSLLNDAMGNLDTFQFDDPFLIFNAVMSDISYILSGTYDALGSFNIPIGFSFTLTVAMLCIGWYRFKAGA